MRNIIIRTCFVCIAGLFVSAMLPVVYPASLTAIQTKEVYTGTVIGVGGTLGGVSRPFTLSIEGVSSNADAITRAMGKPITMSIITSRIAQFGISRNGKTCVAICISSHVTTA